MKRLKLILCCIAVFTVLVSSFTVDASASWYDDVTSGTFSSITGNPYVADTFCGVEARYSLTPGSYQCTELITRFYKEAYGLDVFIFASYGSALGQEPIEMLTSGYEFVNPDTPQAGDVIYSPSSMRENKGDHWAIVKSFNGSTITLFEQNVKSGSRAQTGRKLKYPSSNYIIYSPRSIYDNTKPNLRTASTVTTTVAPTKATTTKAPETTKATTTKPTTSPATEPVTQAKTTVAATTAVQTTVATTAVQTTIPVYSDPYSDEEGYYEVIVPAEDITEESTTAPSEETTTLKDYRNEARKSAAEAKEKAKQESLIDFKPIILGGAAITVLVVALAALFIIKKGRG